MDTDHLEQLLQQATARHGSARSALLPILHQVQAGLGHIPDDAVAPIAAYLNLTRADVHGVISFYHDFRTTPRGEHTLTICRAESCQAMGGRALERQAQTALGIDFHDTSADGRFSLEPVYCLGNCACSPSVMLDDTLHSRVTPELLDELLEQQ